MMRRMPDWVLRVVARLFPRWQAAHNARAAFWVEQSMEIYGITSYVKREGWIFEIYPPAGWQVSK